MSRRAAGRPIAIAESGLTPNAEGIPYSQAFGDVYHSSDGGIVQARRVFLAGNALPARWRGREDFTILETGFGLGLNFLETWRALDEDTLNENGGGPARLHFISVEKFPLSPAALAEAHACWPEHAARSRELADAWPLPLAGFHRLHLAGGRISLTLLLGDAATLLPQLMARVDAFYLDGFAPARNPEMWSATIFEQMRRLAAPGATLATWTVAGAVRDGLAASGFTVEKQTGFGSKREMLAGRLAQSATHDAQRAPRNRRAIVIGAGLAGATCAERLAACGWQVEVLERHPAAALEASGNPAGLATPVINLADAPNAQLSRAAFLYALRHFAALGVQDMSPNVAPSHTRGVLRIARDERDVERFASLLRDQSYPQALACFADRAQGAELAGREVSRAGIWFPSGTNLSPAAICAASLASHGGGITCRFGVHAARLETHADGWRVFDAAGICVASAPVVVVANALGALDFAQTARLRLETVRGQLTLFRPRAQASLGIAVAGESHAVPLPDGRLMLGATFQPGDFDTSVRNTDHAANIARVEAMLPGLCAGHDPAQLEGRVGFRTVTNDRLPAFGPVPDAAPGLYVATGLGARGLVWAALCAELLVAQIADTPWPVSQQLAGTVAPERFGNQPGN